jgi:hypothetical protein
VAEAEEVLTHLTMAEAVEAVDKLFVVTLIFLQQQLDNQFLLL